MSQPEVTLRWYFIVFGSLIGLTLLTVGAAYTPLPSALDFLHTPIALSIAGVKALLVLFFFMHLWQSPRLLWLVAFGSLMWLGIMLLLTFADYQSRAWLTS